MSEDLEAQNGQLLKEETKALTDEKLPEVKVTSKEVSKEMEFKSLTKEELMKFATDPFWVRLRLVLFVLFWLGWIAMLVASVFIIIQAPKCPSPQPKAWWQRGPIYQLDLATFKDSDNDGTGDIKGLISELDYLAETGVNSIHLAPFYPKTGEIVDANGIRSELGTLQDWDALSAALRERNIKVIIDIPMSETENFGSPEVLAAKKTLLANWMGKGVDGFNFSPNVPLSAASKSMVEQLRGFIDAQDDDEERVLVNLEGLELTDQSALYGADISENHVGTLFHLVAGKSLYSLLPQLTASNLVAFINNMQAELPANAWPVLSLSGEDTMPLEEYSEMADAFNMLSNILPATPLIHAGAEIGLPVGKMDWEFQKNETEFAAEGRLTSYSVYSKLTPLRHQETVLFGKLDAREMSGCLVVVRVKKGNPGYLLVINLTTEEQTLDVSPLDNIPENVRILTSSVPDDKYSLPDPEAPKSEPSVELTLQPRESRLYTFVPYF